MKILRRIFLAILSLGPIGGILTSCHDNGFDPEAPQKGESLMLVYAIAANNGLQAALFDDKYEILVSAPNLDLKNNTVLVYSVDNTNSCVLEKLTRNSSTGKYEYVTVATFPELPLSTSPERISEVLNYVNDRYHYSTKGLVLWSHGTGWIPTEIGSTPMLEKRRTFGRDKYEGVNYETNINELAEAIPDGVFDYIWFDCCYMANIETIFELRYKTKRIVGYTEEIASYGMPYNLTTPYLLQRNPDLVGAADELVAYYDRMKYSVPVTIVNTEELDELASASKEIFRLGLPPVNLSQIQNYTRSWLTADGIYFYDMGQLLESYTPVPNDDGTINTAGSEKLAQAKSLFKEMMNRVVEYKVFADYTWPGPVINANHFSGLSMHHYVPKETFDEKYYTTLDWFRATR